MNRCRGTSLSIKNTDFEVDMKFEKLYHKGKSLYQKGHKISAKLIKVFCKICFQCEIPYEAEIDDDVYFCHNAFGVVINPAAKMRGGGTVIQHSVTIGELDGSHKSPTIGKNVFIGAKATLLGDITVGDNARIGAGAVVLQDVPENCTAVGVPARIIYQEK